MLRPYRVPDYESGATKQDLVLAMPDQLIACKSCSFTADEKKRDGETGGAYLC